MDYERGITVAVPFAEAVTRTRAALAAHGFGVLTEIDVQATMRDKRAIEMEPYLILGACNPDLAHQALEIDRSMGVLLPCNVVVRASDGDSIVQVFDPQVMATLTGHPAMGHLAAEASHRLVGVLHDIAGS
jgi:uncharacterized protein (DUF302 family)